MSNPNSNPSTSAVARSATPDEIDQYHERMALGGDYDQPSEVMHTASPDGVALLIGLNVNGICGYVVLDSGDHDRDAIEAFLAERREVLS